MTVHADVPPTLVQHGTLSSVATEDLSERMLGMGKRLLIDGFALLALAIMLGVAETLALWFGAVIVALGLLVLGTLLALTGFAAHLRRGPRR